MNLFSKQRRLWSFMEVYATKYEKWKQWQVQSSKNIDEKILLVKKDSPVLLYTF